MMPKPNLITAWNEGAMGDKEFIVACKGRPFSILTAPQFPTPNVTYVDYSLVHDLNLRLSDMQCRKLSFCGQKLRILGQISTTVQCISNGAPAGNLQFKAHVVEDLKKTFDTHSIAGVKLSNKLLGSSAKMFNENSTEPTDVSSSESPASDVESKKKKKRKKLDKTTMGTRSSDETSSASEMESGDEMTYGDKLVALLNAQAAIPMEEVTINPRHQAIFDSLDLYSNQAKISSPTNLVPDEYFDTYSNVSTIMTGSAARSDLSKTKSAKTNSVSANTTTTQVDTTNHARGQLSSVRQAWIDKLNTGQAMPPHLEHIPVPHGPEWCDRNCAAAQYCGATVSRQCGYYEEMLPDDFYPCSIRCKGQWCSCMSQYQGRNQMSSGPL